MGENQDEIVYSCLTLPSKTGKSSTENILRYVSEDEEPHGLQYVAPYMVDEDSLVLTNDHKKRFARAMRFLALKPSLHPSQLVREVSTFSLPGSKSDDNLLALLNKWNTLADDVKNMLYKEIAGRVRSEYSSFDLVCYVS